MLKLVELSCVVVMASAGALISPLAYTAPFSYTAPLAYAAPLLPPSNYRGVLSLSPFQSAYILAADGRPLDTLDVNLDHAAHYTTKALSGSTVHLRKKLSAAVIAPLPLSRAAVEAHAPLNTHTPPDHTTIGRVNLTYTGEPPPRHW